MREEEQDTPLLLFPSFLIFFSCFSLPKIYFSPTKIFLKIKIKKIKKDKKVTEKNLRKIEKKRWTIIIKINSNNNKNNKNITKNKKENIGGGQVRITDR